MRKLILGACCLFLILASHTTATAQFKFFTGGSAGFSTSSNDQDDSKQSTFNVSPYIGYSATSNFIVGLGLGYQNLKSQSSEGNYNKTGEFVLNPFARYRNSVNDNMGFYGELGLNVGFGNSKLFINDTEFSSDKTNSFGVYLGPGIDYAFADRWVVNALWGALNYTTRHSDNADVRTNSFGLNFNPANIRFSLNYLF